MRLIAGLCGAGLLAAVALSAPAPACADTMLHVSVTGSVTVMPDELVAQLSAQADAPSAAAAQGAVNAMVAKALAAAKPLQAVTASTTSYSVWHQTDPKDVWHASQGVALRSHDGAGLLTLIGQLQAAGLAVGDLSWQLSPALADKSYEQAVANAIGKLTARTQETAALLHLQVHGFTQIVLGDGSGPEPRPMMRLMAAEAPAAAPPPSAQAEAMTVTATVNGTARLETAGN